MPGEKPGMRMNLENHLKVEYKDKRGEQEKLLTGALSLWVT
jgi:hypothetical protein